MSENILNTQREVVDFRDRNWKSSLVSAVMSTSVWVTWTGERKKYEHFVCPFGRGKHSQKINCLIKPLRKIFEFHLLWVDQFSIVEINSPEQKWDKLCEVINKNGRLMEWSIYGLHVESTLCLYNYSYHTTWKSQRMMEHISPLAHDSHIGWFVDDSTVDVEHVQNKLPD